MGLGAPSTTTVAMVLAGSSQVGSLRSESSRLAGSIG